jgi:hypothetical protein
MPALSIVFGDRIISSDTFPARSPDLNPCDFFFCDCLKGKVYNSNPRTEELKENIRMEIANNSCRTASKGKSEPPPPVRRMSTCTGTAFSAPPVICEF